MVKHRNLGFTLIELLAVIVLLAIILAIAVPNISQTLKSTSKSAFESDAKMVLTSIKYKKLEIENFDVTSVDKNNINTILGLSGANYSSISIEMVGNITLITLRGANKWNGLVACGTYENMKVVESINDCSSDVTAPVITILGSNPASVNMGESYSDAGATAVDGRDGEVTGKITVTSNVNPSIPGAYTVTYRVIDMSGNQSIATRTVNVLDNEEPVVSINPNGRTVRGKLESVSVDVTDFGLIDSDSLKYKWTEETIQPANETIVLPFVNNESIPAPLDVSGTFYLWVKASDISGNNAVIRSDAFNIDNKAPVITINGLNPYGIPVGGTYSDAGATAVDETDGSVTVTVTSNVNPNIAGTYAVTYTATDSIGNVATSSRIVKILGPINDESIIAAIQNTDYPSGNYTMNINGEAYDIELISITGNTTYSTATGATVNLGDAIADQRMLIVKYNGNLTVDSGVTVTSTTRKKGMFIYATGTLTNNGTISMTARGAIAAGQSVYLWKNTNGTYESIPAIGSVGGATVSLVNAGSIHKAGLDGVNGSNRSTGGGGSGGVFNNVEGTAKSGVGGSGTSYSGGSGGGATTYRGTSTYTGYAGSSTGGAGGAGHSNKYSDSGGYSAGGGAGNPGGVGVGTACCTYDSGGNGTGGLLILYGNSINNNGVISSNGIPGGLGSGASGGSSGGGSINIFATDTYNSSGSVTASGGAAQALGSKGGDGSVTAGYIYNSNFTTLYPIITITPNTDATYRSLSNVGVIASDIKSGIKPGSTKYLWTTTPTQPLETDIVNNFVNGNNIPYPTNVSGPYYLWIIAKNNQDRSTIKGAGPFNIDTIAPVITINGLNPTGIYVDGVYADNGATATDNRDGSVAVQTISNINPSIEGVYTVTYTAGDSVGNVTTAIRTVNVIGPGNREGLLAQIKDINMTDGYHTVTVNNTTYDIELITINGNTTYNIASGATVSLGDAIADQKMLIVKYNGDLTIDAGVTVTATTRKKGMLIYVAGTLTNNGTISMTARGAIAAGQDVYLWKNANGTYEYVPTAGGTGAVAVTGEINGVIGTNGTNRATGGGGGGASMRGATRGGNGSAGTSYSGGSGGGGASSAADSGVVGKSAVANGGAGGAAVGRRTSTTMYVASGGAGNTGGNDARPTAGANITVTGNAASSAESGTGGLLIVYANTVTNNGTIESRGSASNFPAGYNTSVAASGGSSGGGSVNVFYNAINNIGTITAQGGQSGACARIGGNGGDGSVTTTQINW